MAANLQTSCVGEEEGQEGQQDIEVWLDESRLKKFEPYFKENEITFEDVLTWDEDDMNTICSECNITASVIKKRFKLKVREYQRESNKTNAQTPGFGKTYRIVVTEKESEAMDALKTKLVEINEWIAVIENKAEQLSKDETYTKGVEINIASLFAEIRKKVDEREKTLMMNLTNIPTEQLKALQKQIAHLKQYTETIKAAMTEQDVVSLDPNMDSAKRQSKILKITTDALMNIDEKRVDNSSNEINFIIDDNALYKNIANVGVVTAQSDPPDVQISDIANYAAKITLDLPTEYKVDDDDSIDYQLRYKVSSDDEKTGDWNDINIDNNNNEYWLLNLQSDTEYEVRGRYGSAIDSLWSRYSQKVVFKTMNIKNEWDIGCKGSSLAVNGAIVRQTRGTWASIWVKGVVSTGLHIWKFKILKHVGQASDFFFGLTNENDTKKKDSYPGPLTYWAYSSKSYGDIYDAKKESTRIDSVLEEKDIVTVKMDFTTMQLSFFRNEHQVGPLITVQNGEYRAVMSLYYSGNAVELL